MDKRIEKDEEKGGEEEKEEEDKKEEEKTKCFKSIVKPSNPNFDELPLKSVQQFIDHCWSEDASKGPSFEEIFNEIKNSTDYKMINPPLDRPIIKPPKPDESNPFSVSENCWSKNTNRKSPYEEIINELLKNNKDFISSDSFTDNKMKNPPLDVLNINQNIEKEEKSMEEDEDEYEYEEEEYEEDEYEYEYEEEDNFSGIIEQLISTMPLDIKKIIRKKRIIEYQYDSIIYKIIEKDTNKTYAAKVPYNVYVFVREITILLQINHPSIIEFIGYTLIGVEKNKMPAIVTEYCRNGSLDRIIEFENEGEEIEGWDSTKKLIIIYGIASAMSYLHSKNIIHRNLNPSNILLDDSLFPKLGGFSISIFLNDKNFLKMIPNFLKEDSKLLKDYSNYLNDDSEELIGTAPYIAPEIWNDHEYSKASDVFAFAMCAYEILTGKFVYRDKQDATIMHLVCYKKERPKFHKTFPNCFQQLITKCWSDDPNKRPSFDEIVNELIKNDDFITNKVDKEFYHLYIDICDKKLKGIDTKQIEKQLIKDDEKDSIYKKLQEIVEKKEKLNEQEKAEILKSINVKQINIDEFDIIKTNESGGYGFVYKIQNKKTKEIYAAKTLRRKKHEKEFLREIKILSDINHPLIIKLVGYSLTDFSHKNNLVFITEYVVNGSLQDILDIESAGSIDEANIEMWNNTYKLINIYGIASAISYLHHNNFLHLDLKPGNVLLDDYLFPKICDFGLSIKIGENLRINLNKLGTILFMAPEKVNEGISNEKTDIYSFGMILHETKTTEHPFDKLSAKNILCKKQFNEALEIDSTIPRIYRELIKKCLDNDPTQRPTIDEIISQLRNQQEFIQDDVNNDLYSLFIKIIDSIIKGEDVTTIKNNFPTYRIYKNDLTTYASTQSMSLTAISNLYEDIEKTGEIEDNLISNIYEYRNKTTGKTYAVTISNIPILHFNKEEIKTETEKLLKLNHPCIQQLYGYSSHDKENQPKPMIVNEILPKKTLFDIIENERKDKHEQEWTSTTKLIAIYGIASGMSYLHSHKIYHPKLNPKNIRFDSKFHPKICEIGFHIRPENSKTISRTTTKEQVDDTLLYLSPEILKSNENVTGKSDVYSYALIVYEIITNQIPFDKEIQLHQNLKKITDENYRPEIPSTVPSVFKEFIERCWSNDPNQRPSFSELVEELENKPEFITPDIKKEDYLEYQKYVKQNQK